MAKRISLTIFITIFSVFQLLAQFKNLKLNEYDVPVKGETSIAIDLKNPLIIVAVSAPDNIYISKDGGKGWQKKKVESSYGVGDNLSVLNDGSGTFFLFHQSKASGADTSRHDKIVVQISGDGGMTWTDGDLVGTDFSKDHRHARPSVDAKGNLSVVWTAYEKYSDNRPECKSRLLMSTSRSGKKWSTPIVVSQNDGDCAADDNTPIGGNAVTSFDGKSFVMWAQSGKIKLDRSFDGKLWLSSDIDVKDIVRGWRLTIPGHGEIADLPILMTDRSKSYHRGITYIAWADQRNGENDTDIWFDSSPNFGDNWSTQVKVNNDDSHRHQYLPSTAIDQTNGIIYAVFYDRRNYEDNNTDVYLAWSADGGATFKNAKVSESAFLPSEEKSTAGSLGISAHKGVIAVSWTRWDNGVVSTWASIISQTDLDKIK